VDNDNDQGDMIAEDSMHDVVMLNISLLLLMSRGDNANTMYYANYLGCGEQGIHGGYDMI
jgi:hypothetical protein